MLISNVIQILEDLAPLSLQEKYDNAGLLTGSASWEATGALCTIDVTKATIEEAIKLKTNLIISHHPFIFGQLKSVTGKNETEEILIQAIKNDIAIYAAHTNLDKVELGVNHIIAEKLGLSDIRILSPEPDALVKLATFVPVNDAKKVRSVMMENGAGHIGNYDYCSYNIEGEGTFRAGDNTNPHVGNKGTVHTEKEVRIETIVPKHTLNKVIRAMTEAHPYEEVAYDVYPLKNKLDSVGSGIIGNLSKSMNTANFLKKLKEVFGIPAIKYSGLEHNAIRKVAVCGGSGSFLLGNAIAQNADAFLTGDVKYHQFFEAENKLLYCDIGHYESEQFTKELFYSLLTKKFSTFAVHLTSIVTNPVKYYV